MNSKVDIKGDAGVAVSHNQGTINIYMDKTSKKVSPELRRAIGELLGICDPRNERKLIERISAHLYKTTDFKSLEINQVRALTLIASEIAETVNAAKMQAIKTKRRWWLLFLN